MCLDIETTLLKGLMVVNIFPEARGGSNNTSFFPHGHNERLKNPVMLLSLCSVLDPWEDMDTRSLISLVLPESYSLFSTFTVIYFIYCSKATSRSSVEEKELKKGLTLGYE